MSYLLGIDLGTTYTAAAVLRRRGDAPEMVALGTQAAAMPSVLLVADDGSVLVGEAAERRAVAEPDRVAREFKRRIGDPTPVALGGQAFAAPELAAMLVRHVVEAVARQEGGPAERIAVTHPASWGAHKLDLLGAALSEAGVGPVRFLAEPQAAAVCYAAAERVEPGSTIAVYDLGGGTFDAAVLRKDPDVGFVLLGRPEGVEFLGGVDFDEVVFEHVRAGAPEAFAGLDESDPAVWAAVARLRRECREAKEALSADTEVSIPVWMGTSRTAVRLHRADFEELIRDRIEDSVTALRRAVASAGLDPLALSSVLLVGGSSRIPLVAQLVSEQMGRPVSVDADPKNAIAKGAVLALLDRVPAGSGVAGAGLAAAPGPLPWSTGGSEPVGGPQGSWPPAAPADADQRPTAYVDPAYGETAYVDPGSGGHRPTRYVDPVVGSGGHPTTTYDQDPPTEVLPVVGATNGYGAHDGYDDDGATTVAPTPPESPGRSPALLIGAGAVVAALAVVAAVVFWPKDQTVSNATPELPSDPTSSAAVPPPAPSGSPATPEDRAERDRASGVVPTPQPGTPGGGGGPQGGGGQPGGGPPGGTSTPQTSTSETKTSTSTNPGGPEGPGNPERPR